jgi:hypothetical protein
MVPKVKRSVAGRSRQAGSDSWRPGTRAHGDNRSGRWSALRQRPSGQLQKVSTTFKCQTFESSRINYYLYFVIQTFISKLNNSIGT